MMIQRFVVVLLMIIFIGCGEDEPEQVKPKEVVNANEVIDEEPKRRIIWETDGVNSGWTL